jgi:cytochrome P450
MENYHASFEERAAATSAFSDFAHTVIEAKRTSPADDLLSELVLKGELTDTELVGAAMMLFSAGHETTANTLALSTFFLLCDRSRWDALRADPSSIAGAVEELLRYITIVQTGAATRTALEDVDLNGTTIRAGESVCVSLAAANRDPARFTDPDRFDPSRDANDHLAFGHGRHMCLGQHIARLELQIGLAGLMRRFPTLSLAVPAQDVQLYHGDHQLYGVHELPVAW